TSRERCNDLAVTGCRYLVVPGLVRLAGQLNELRVSGGAGRPRWVCVHSLQACFGWRVKAGATGILARAGSNLPVGAVRSSETLRGKETHSIVFFPSLVSRAV